MTTPGKDSERVKAKDDSTAVLVPIECVTEDERTIGRYRIEAELGDGGAGRVYRARHLHTDRVVALKLLHDDLAKDEGIRARFLREARVGGRIKHPGAVTVLDFDHFEGQAYLVMELVDGADLREILNAAPLEHSRIAEIFCGILDVLEAVHAEGVIHRDLKPNNVKVLEGDRVKLLDFGIARLHSNVEEPLTELGTFVGTPAYAAPEQILGRQIGPTADLYAVGLMLFEALTGIHPFGSDTAQGYVRGHLRDTAPALGDLRPELAGDDALAAVIRQSLEKEASRRFPSAAAFSVALKEALSKDSSALRRSGAGLDRALVICDTASDRIRLFFVGGTRMSFGRSDRDPRRGIVNDLVFRLLPLSDPENRADTRRISNAHGEILVKGQEASIVDRSARGTSLNGARLTKGEARSLPEMFELDIGGGVLKLEGCVIRARASKAKSVAAGTTVRLSDAEDGERVEAIVLKRVSNTPEHVYVLLVGSVSVGSSTAAAIGVSGLHGDDLRFSTSEGVLQVELTGSAPRPLTPGEWRHGEAGFTVIETRARHFSEVDSDE